MESTHPQISHLEKVIYDFCANYSKSPGRGERLIIFGENGSGKTHAARAVFHWASQCGIAIKMPLVTNHDTGECSLANCVCYSWPAVVDGFKKSDPEWYVIEEMFNPSLLILDDVGAEHDPSRVGIEKLYLVLERRAQKWTIITTNVPPQHWERKFERRVASRFFRNSTHVDLSQVPDYNSK